MILHWLVVMSMHSFFINIFNGYLDNGHNCELQSQQQQQQQQQQQSMAGKTNK